MKKRKRTGGILLALAMICISFTLRGPITSIGSLAGLIHDDLGVSNGFIGFITTLPLLAFAVCSPFLFKVSRRFGIGRVMFAGILLALLGGIVRSFLGMPGLIAGTLLIGIGICIGNIMVPAVIKLKFPGRIGILTSLYITGQGIFAAVGAGASYPLAVNAGLGWKLSLSVWCILSLAALIIWLPQLGLADVARAGDMGREEGKQKKGKGSVVLLKSKLAIYITIFMGAQSLCFYSITAWLPSILMSDGMSPELAGFMALWYQIISLPASFIIPIVTARKKINQLAIVIGICMCYFIGVICLTLNNAPLFIMLALIILSTGGGGTFAWIVATIGLKSRDAEQSAQLTGMAQALGYALAAAGPTLCGLLYDFTQDWNYAIGLILVVITAMIFAGIAITKNDKL